MPILKHRLTSYLGAGRDRADRLRLWLSWHLRHSWQLRLLLWERLLWELWHFRRRFWNRKRWSWGLKGRLWHLLHLRLWLDRGRHHWLLLLRLNILWDFLDWHFLGQLLRCLWLDGGQRRYGRLEILLWHWGGSLDLRCLLHWLHLLDWLHLLGLHLLGLHRLRLHLLRRNLLGLNLLRLHWRNLFYLDWLLRQLFWDYLRRWRLFNWLRLLLRDCWNGWRLGLSWLLSVLALLSHLLCRDLVRLLHLHLGHLLLSVVDLALVVGLLH